MDSEQNLMQLSTEVAEALHDGRPVVALESTVYSNLGLPSPANETALQQCLDAIRMVGAVPAVTAVLDGQIRAGLNDHEYERILGTASKVAERDLPIAVAGGWPVGATTVSASLTIAARSGISVFATGGIGGVHRGVGETGDVSADLGAIARHRVVTVSAGAKSFLDLGQTLERLETLSVPIVGWETNELPAFTARSSGLALAHRIDELSEMVAVARIQLELGRSMLVVNPVPQDKALDQDVHDSALQEALNAAETAGITGAAITPFVLERVATASGGQSIPANVALVANNARLAAEIAAGLAGLSEA